MKTINRIVIIALSVFISATFNSCKKNDRDQDTETTSSRDNAIAESTFAGVLKSIGEFTDSTWTTVLIPLSKFPFEAKDFDLERVKQFIIQLEGDGNIYLDEIKFIKIENEKTIRS